LVYVRHSLATRWQGKADVGGVCTARRELVREGEVGVFHCVQRCVRRAFLCGDDRASGQSFEHRRAWIRGRLEDLAGAFAVEVCGYAVMANHLHVIVRVRPDLAATWSPEELAQRWWRLHPSRRDATGEPAAAGPEELEAILAARAGGEQRVLELRSRLSSLSWFMGHLAEPIARRANKEDRCTGRFWEGRFKSQALLDEAAMVACALYVGLNPIRAGLATTPETSAFTAEKDRIDARQAIAALRAVGGDAAGSLASAEAVGAREMSRAGSPASPVVKALPTEGNRPLETPLALLRQQARRAEWLCPIGATSGYLPSLDLDRYLTLLDWTGRQLASGKPGAIPAGLPPILERLRLDVNRWVDLVRQFGDRFRRVAGSVAAIAAEAARAGCRWLHGVDRDVGPRETG
jgi:REP element-mobilizing transposase RayT